MDRISARNLRHRNPGRPSLLTNPAFLFSQPKPSLTLAHGVHPSSTIDGRHLDHYQHSRYGRFIKRSLSISVPVGKELKQSRRAFKTPRQRKPDKEGILRYRARKADCAGCRFKTRCCPKAPQRKVTRSVYEPSRDVARQISQTIDYAISCKLRKKVEMLFADLKRILKLDRLRLPGPCGARDEFHLAATAQNLRKLAKLVPASGNRQQLA